MTYSELLTAIEANMCVTQAHYSELGRLKDIAQHCGIDCEGRLVTDICCDIMNRYGVTCGTRLLGDMLQVISEATSLPIEYTKVDYIEATGSQEIIDDTLLYGDGIHEYDIQFSEIGTCQLMGYSTGAACYWGVDEDGLFELGGNITIANANPLERNKVVFNISAKTATLIVGENTISRTGKSVDNKAHCMFNLDSDKDYHCKAKLYGFTHADADGNIDRNCVPCTRNEDGVSGLYDTINKVFNPMVGIA